MPELLDELNVAKSCGTLKKVIKAYQKVALTRQEPRFVLGASPRAMLALMRASQAKAFLQERDYVKPDDVKEVAMKVLLHRLVLTPEARIQKADAAGILKSLILKAKVPME